MERRTMTQRVLDALGRGELSPEQAAMELTANRAAVDESSKVGEVTLPVVERPPVVRPLMPGEPVPCLDGNNGCSEVMELRKLRQEIDARHEAGENSREKLRRRMTQLAEGRVRAARAVEKAALVSERTTAALINGMVDAMAAAEVLRDLKAVAAASGQNLRVTAEQVEKWTRQRRRLVLAEVAGERVPGAPMTQKLLPTCRVSTGKPKVAVPCLDGVPLARAAVKAARRAANRAARVSQ